MQQTEKYKFKIIETSDTFSPEALNANAEAVEAELARVEAETETRLAALANADAAITKAIGSDGSNARVAWGVFDTTDQPMTLTFDFKPVLLVLGDRYFTLAVFGASAGQSTAGSINNMGQNQVYNIVWGDNSISFTRSKSPYMEAQTHYVVLGVSRDADGE